MKRFARWLVFGCLIALLSPLIVVAQTSPEGQSAQELRRQLDELRAQMAAQTKLMNAIQTRLDNIAFRASSPSVKPGASGMATNARRWPSDDQAGAQSSAGSLVRLTAGPPSAGNTQMSRWPSRTR